MRPRDKISASHEKAVVDQFVSWLNSKNSSNFAVVERPDPPDAIINDGEITSWVEHCDLYRSHEEARSELSFITPGEIHTPHSEHPISEPDNRIAQKLVKLMRSKLGKSSYLESFQKYGCGYLVISERDPLFNNDSLLAINDAIDSEVFS